MGLFRKLGHGGGVGGLASEIRPGLQDIGHQHPDDQGEGRDDLEVEQRLDADASHLLGVLDVGDAGDHGAEDDGCDHHLDQLDEAVTQGLHPVIGGNVRRQPAQQAANDDGEEHLHVQDLVEGLLLGCQTRLFDRGFHEASDAVDWN